MNLRTLIKKRFPTLIDFWNRFYNELAHAKYNNKPMDSVFTNIYMKNHWNGKLSRSGTGSEASQTTEVKIIIKRVIDEYKISTLLDIPCGDLNWIKDVDLSNITYYGSDIVEEIIRNNKANIKENHHFMIADITSSKLPSVDLILCRDCLVHFSYDDIKKAVANLKLMQSKYILTTTFPSHNNYDIVTGNWRPINLEAKPLNFPPPIAVFNEKCSEDSRYHDKSLGLWRIFDLP